MPRYMPPGSHQLCPICKDEQLEYRNHPSIPIHYKCRRCKFDFHVDPDIPALIFVVENGEFRSNPNYSYLAALDSYEKERG